MPFFEHNHASIYYEVRGKGTPLVFLHGFSMHTRTVIARNFLKIFSPQYRIATLDNRGCGQTRVQGAVSIADMAGDAAALMDHLGMESAHIMGLSMGGVIALTLALQAPQRVRTLVLAFTTARTDTTHRTNFWLETSRKLLDEGVSQELHNRFIALMTMGDQIFSDTAIVNALLNAPPDPYSQSAEQFQQQYDAMRQLGRALYDRLGEIHIPALILSSPDDILVPAAYQEELASALPDAQIRHYAGGHVAISLPMNHAAFMQEVTQFWQTQG